MRLVFDEYIKSDLGGYQKLLSIIEAANSSGAKELTIFKSNRKKRKQPVKAVV